MYFLQSLDYDNCENLLYQKEERQKTHKVIVTTPVILSPGYNKFEFTGTLFVTAVIKKSIF